MDNLDQAGFDFVRSAYLCLMSGAGIENGHPCPTPAGLVLVMCLYVCPHMCMRAVFGSSQRSEEDTDGYEPPCGCRELKQGPGEEQLVAPFILCSSTEPHPSLQGSNERRTSAWNTKTAVA